MSLSAQFRNPPSFVLTQSLFLRLLGLVYLAAFASLWPQVTGLIGSHGIAPADEALAALRGAFRLKAYFYVPTLFWFSASDAALTGACVTGCLAGLLMMSGFFTRYASAVCFVLYLSLTTAGQPFTGFQWDALLLECGFLALFAGIPSLIWAYRLLLFRLMFESGVVKLASHDPNWSNLHALRFHFLTQPLPTPLAYYFYRAPNWFLDACTAATLAIELVAPLLLFLPRRWRYSAGISFIALQIAILITGNYAFFNLLTLCLCLWCFDDSLYVPLQRILERNFPAEGAPSNIVRGAGTVVLLLLMTLGILQVCVLVLPASARPIRAVMAFIEPFEIVNSYGLFAVMTTSRPEIIIEGSDDQTHWTEYSFRYKPGELHRSLPQVAPYQPRLDWQMWFAALGSYRTNPWVGSLVYRLLLGEPSVTALLSPYPSAKPPKYIRAELYEYTFSEPAERARTGVVWNRKLLGNWLGPVSLPVGSSENGGTR